MADFRAKLGAWERTGRDAEAAGDQKLDYTAKYYALLKLAPAEHAAKIDEHNRWQGGNGKDWYESSLRFLKNILLLEKIE